MPSRSQNVTGRPRRKPGPPKLYPERIVLTMPAGMTTRIDAARAAAEDRLDVIRSAIERELRRRERLSRVLAGDQHCRTRS